MPNRVSIFWTDENTHDWILSELADGRARQGWGIPGLQLTENGKVVPFETWAERFRHVSRTRWGGDATIDQCKTRHSILMRMLELQRGDLLLVPRMPRVGEFCIAQVTDGYAFDDSYDDFGHVVRVDDRLKSYRHDSSDAAKEIAAKFRHYRSAVNFVADPVYAETIRTLYRG